MPSATTADSNELDAAEQCDRDGRGQQGEELVERDLRQRRNGQAARHAAEFRTNGFDRHVERPDGAAGERDQ